MGTSIHNARGSRWPRRDGEPRPETTALRLVQPAAGLPLVSVVETEGLLGAEGFTHVDFIREPDELRLEQAIMSGGVDAAIHFLPPLLRCIDGGAPLVIIAGAHLGASIVLGADHVRTVGDLRGRTVAACGAGSADRLLLALVLADHGVDPWRDVTWVFAPEAELGQRLRSGAADGLLARAPLARVLTAASVGHMLVRTALDAPWSPYFDGAVAVRREFLQACPVAARCLVRALLEATDRCGFEPERVARTLTASGSGLDAELVRQTVRELPYAQWRGLDLAASIRFFADRLKAAGLVHRTADDLMEAGTDWEALHTLEKASAA